MPTPMKRTATTLLNHSSKTFSLLYILPTLPMAKAISHAKIITGIPVAIAKIAGRYSPEGLATVIGISIAK